MARNNKDEIGPIVKAALFGLSAAVLYIVGRAKGREDIREPHLEAQSKPVIDVETVEESEMPAALALPMGNSTVSTPVLETVKKQNSVKTDMEISHSPDFRAILKMGEEYILTEKQGSVIQKLWEMRERGINTLPEGELMKNIGTADKKRVRDTFKSNQRALKALIRPGKKRGTYCLNND